MLKAYQKSQAGFSLAELMVGAVVGLLVLSGVIAMYSTTIGASTDNLQVARLNQELRATLGVMMSDIRRSGYYAGVPGVDDMTNNPFQQGASDLAVDDIGGVADACITYTYDRDRDKAVGDGTGGTTMEQYGFRLNSNAVQLRTGGNDFSCTGGTWLNVTSGIVEVTQLDFTVAETCLNVITEAVGCPCTTDDPCQHIREVDITITGRLASDDQVQQTITETIRVRNDKFVAAAP